ncbi:50S ribosomal protein L20 [Candidatus Kaiserbacteria bacterium RIFCSPHIGHO2_02_FULL_54_11b]|uniref:Large ribosomal subunit protein bL20 n=2 Tax=Candidatus Kaiseribacteriota TaxID=1752734 RepID=A0A1F6CS73_9BACT|nr:MAG: 50S ribosomal protein L20 [Candidatus Kaiserbacteria bacterium RIFCSPHIGHO2_01_FULL_54_36b]OGG64970.1 MAG: 50S ribosomal protein L20 [Candidatus Kaiserbacteria bacterium RIFCSPHIGHO2_02_FULL_54_11b]
MVRVKRGVTKLKRRRNVLAQTKGYRFNRSTKERTAKEAIQHAGVHAFRHRRSKKREYRNLWSLRINAAARPLGLSYSKFINALKKADIKLDRKVLSELAQNHPEVFARLTSSLKS